MNTKSNIELRSEEVQEILGKPPRWIVRVGISIILLVVAGLFVGSYFIKYPDILSATITITTENLPAGVIAKTTGKIDTLFVVEKQIVQQGDLLAMIDNPANFEDVLALKSELQQYNRDSVLHRSWSLGDIQQAYFAFLKAHEDYQYFMNADYHNKKIGVIQQQIRTQKSIMQKSQNQLILSQKQLESSKQLFAIDSALFTKNALSLSEYQTAKNSLLQQLQSYENAKMSIDNQQMSILQSEQTIFDLEQQRIEEENNLTIALSGAYDQLQTQIKNWEQTYLLIAPCNGTVTMTKYWQKNQNVNAGEVMVTVVPQEATKIVGKILLPPQGAGKVKKGQSVNVKFDNYPYMEFGMVKVEISNISLVPVLVDEKTKAYMLEVIFPNQLTTNYGKTLTFSQEMTGTAEIITDDLRLLDKFLNPIKAVIKK